jgi:hypothetical protein
MNEWANLTQRIVRNFVPSINRETLGDLAPPRHAGTVDNYNFAAYVLHVGITNELLQITLLITGLPDPLREHLAPPNDNATGAIPNTDANYDHTAQQDVDAPAGKMQRDSAPPPAMTPTPPAKAPVPLVGYNTGSAVHPDDIDINVTLAIGLLEHRINTTFIIGSGNEVPCQAVAFVVPLWIDAEVFDINAYLLDIGNDIDIIPGTPWLASLGLLTWDFSTLQLQYHRKKQPHHLHDSASTAYSSNSPCPSDSTIAREDGPPCFTTHTQWDEPGKPSSTPKCP